MKTYRVAILGCRGRGTAAARAYHAHPRVQVVAVCDLVSQLRDTLGTQLGVAARYDDLDTMIREQSPDLVVIATGTEFHHDLTLRVLAHGVHVDVEKPLCTSLEEADAVLRCSRAQGVRLAVHHQGRVGSSMRAVQQALAAGRVGAARHLLGSGKGYYGGYGLMNIGTHMLNNMLGVAGHCLAVSADLFTAGRRSTPQDVLLAAGGMGPVAGERIVAQLEFGGGVSGTLLQQRFPKVDSTAYALEVLGTEGRLFWSLAQAWWSPVPHLGPGNAGQWQKLEAAPVPGFVPGGPADEADYAYAHEFVTALDEGREHECGGPEGHHVMEILMGIFAAGMTGRRVTLPQPDRDHPLLRWRREAGLPPPESVPRDYGAWLAAEDARLGRSAP
ncbi:MAG: Gfo/Idh/MocA family oxidoreductase [Candidatus Latescibacterota bacterium]